jgi:hypothetical protein
MASLDTTRSPSPTQEGTEDDSVENIATLRGKILLEPVSPLCCYHLNWRFFAYLQISGQQLHEIAESGIVADSFEYAENRLQSNSDEPFLARIVRIDTQSQLVYVQPSYCTHDMKKLNVELE